MRLLTSDFLLTILLSCAVSKLWPIIGQIFASDSGCFTITPSLGVIPCEYPDKRYSPETRVIFLPDAENLTIVSSFFWTKHRNVTDRQTEGRTDGRMDRQNRSGYYSGHALRAMRTRAIKSGYRYDVVFVF